MQDHLSPRFAVCIGGVIAAPVMHRHYPSEGLIQAKSLHILGEQDFVRKVCILMEAPCVACRVTLSSNAWSALLV